MHHYDNTLTTIAPSAGQSSCSRPPGTLCCTDQGAATHLRFPPSIIFVLFVPICIETALPGSATIIAIRQKYPRVT